MLSSYGVAKAARFELATVLVMNASPIVEKTDTNTTFTSLRDRLNGLDRSSDTLGGIWYSGLVGGTPRVPLKHLPGAGDPKPGA